jgi:hypothetical protein
MSSWWSRLGVVMVSGHREAEERRHDIIASKEREPSELLPLRTSAPGATEQHNAAMMKAMMKKKGTTRLFPRFFRA